MSVRIIIDSTADHTASVREQCAIVPLTVHFGDTEYIDGVSITHSEFYEKLTGSQVLPTTSQPTPDSFAKAYRTAISEGNQVVVVTISSHLSGTYQSACIAAMDYPEDVFVVDSLSAALGTGILAEYALQLAEQGLAAKEIADRLTQERERICLVALVDTLEYLKKGGRVSKTVAFAGELLSIKPIISLPGGKVEVISKARGLKQAQANLDKEITQAGGMDPSMPYVAGYAGTCGAPLEQYLKSTAVWPQDTPSTLIGSAIGTHVGPGAIAVAFFRNR